jgi:hypothetical protein
MYRIIKEDKFYFVQKKFLFWWITQTKRIGDSGWGRRDFGSSDEAEGWINEQKKPKIGTTKEVVKVIY